MNGKQIRRWSVLALFLLLLLVPSTVFAGERYEDEYDQQYRQGIEEIRDALPRSVRDSIDGSAFRSPNKFGEAVQKLIQSVLDETGGSISSLVGLFGLVAASLVVCAFVNGTLPSNGGAVGKAAGSVCSVGAVASVAVCAASLASEATELLDTSQVFLSGFVPVFTGVLLSEGRTAATAVYASSITAVAAVASTLVSALIRPLVGVVLGLSAVSTLNGGIYHSLTVGLKKGVLWVLGIVTTIFIGMVGLKTAIAVSGDGLASRATRYLVSSAVPIVGASVNEAVSTVQSSLAVIRTGLGAAGIVGICAIYLPPLLKGVLTGAAVYLCGVAADLLGLSEVGKGIAMMKNGVDVITSVIGFHFLALTVCTSVMLGLGRT